MRGIPTTKVEARVVSSDPDRERWKYDVEITDVFGDEYTVETRADSQSIHCSLANEEQPFFAAYPWPGKIGQVGLASICAALRFFDEVVEVELNPTQDS
jgi:hypothetical protein